MAEVQLVAVAVNCIKTIKYHIKYIIKDLCIEGIHSIDTKNPISAGSTKRPFCKDEV